MAGTQKERLVVIGNGMAGARVVEEILTRDPDRFAITMFGAESYGNYNRILLSNVLNGLCRQCDGRGYLRSADEACPACQASGDADIWHRARITKPAEKSS